MSLLPETVQLEALLGEEPRLRALARALINDPATADEVVYETLGSSAGRPLPRGGLRRYLGKAVRSRILDRLRSERRRHCHERQAARSEAVPSTVDVVGQAEIRQELTAAVTGLTEPYRSTIWLRYYEDLPPRKIAERMSAPVNTVHTRVQRGLEQLRSTLDARHNGDRRAWTACLTPWAIRGKQTTTLTTGNSGATVMKRILVSAAAAPFVVVGIWMGASLLLQGSPSPSGARAIADGRPLVGDVETGVARAPLPESPTSEAPQFGGRLFHHDGRPARGVAYGTFSDGPDRPDWTRAPESPVFLPSASWVEWKPSATTTDDGGWILPPDVTPPAVVSFKVEGVHVASFEISPDSRDLVLPEFVSVEVYLSDHTPGDNWFVASFLRRDDGFYKSGFFEYFVTDAGSCAVASYISQENAFFHGQGDSLSIPALRGQKMGILFMSAGVDPKEARLQWVTAPEIVTFTVKERWPVITAELLEWDQGPRATLLVESDIWPWGPEQEVLSPDGVARLRVREPETDMHLVLRSEEGESFSTGFRLKEGEMSQTISFIRGKGTMAQEILLPDDASVDSVLWLEVESPSETADLEWTRRRGAQIVQGIHEFGTWGVLVPLAPTLYRTARGLLVGDLPKGWAQMIVVMNDDRLARVLPGLPLRANWFEPLEILLPEGVSADQVQRRGVTAQYRQPKTSEPIWRVLRPLSPRSGLPSGHLRLRQLPEGWTQMLLRVNDGERTLGRFARVLPESLPLRAQWLPDDPLDHLAPIDLKALREAHALDTSAPGNIFLTLEPWGSSPQSDSVLAFGILPDTEKWPVWNLRVPQGMSYQLWFAEWEGGGKFRWQKLPAPRLR